jgi:hypothetical protein
MTATIHPYDLQARAELATQGLTMLLDKQRDGLMYFLANWRSRPPRADHGLWDCGDGCGRHTDALTLARSMLRKDSPAARRESGDLQLEAWMLRFLGKEGLSWLPPEPWAEPWGAELLMTDIKPGQQCAEISWAQRGTLMGLISRFLYTKDEQYLAHAKRMIDGLLRVAVRHPDGLFFPEGYYRPDGWHTNQIGLFPGIEEVNAAVVVPAIRIYEEMGYPPALDLADGLVRFALKHTQGYSPDGKMVAQHGGNVQEHFHTRSSFMMSVLKLGITLGRREYVAWARQGYAHALAWGTDFGWFPEHIGQRHGEICCTTDMIELALLLGHHVDQAYYADAERFGRNQLLESQILSLDLLENAIRIMPEDNTPPPYGGLYSNTEDVARRQLGGFASRSTLNDAFHLDATMMMQCCNAAGTRGLYDLWHYAIEDVPTGNADCLHEKIHLRFSVEMPTLKVVSHEPAVGQLDITTRHACLVDVRLPAGSGEVLALHRSAPGGPRVDVLRVSEGYARFESSGEECVELVYPLSERSASYRVGSSGRDLHCTATWRGETVMHMDPAGLYYPLYDRAAPLPPVVPSLPVGPLIASI